MKGKRFRLSRMLLVKEAISHGDLHRCRNKFENLEPGKILVGAVTKVLDFGFHLHFGGRLRGFLPRAQCVDRFIPDHKGLLQLGELTVAKVTEVDQEKQRFLLTTKESDVDQDALPEWIQESNVMKQYAEELNAYAE